MESAEREQNGEMMRTAYHKRKWVCSLCMGKLNEGESCTYRVSNDKSIIFIVSWRLTFQMFLEQLESAVSALVSDTFSNALTQIYCRKFITDMLGYFWTFYSWNVERAWRVEESKYLVQNPYEKFQISNSKNLRIPVRSLDLIHQEILWNIFDSSVLLYSLICFIS